MHRDANIDGLKFLLIFLVVLGHINEPNYSALPTRLIYSFHMPVFIFLSGYLTSVHTDLKKLLMWTLKLGCIYLLAGTSLNLLSWATDRPVSTAQWLLLKPQFAMWYLLALIYWRWAIYLLHDNISTERIFAGSICLALLIGFIPASIDTGLLAIHRTITFLPCFTLGYWFRHEQRFVNVLSKIPPHIHINNCNFIHNQYISTCLYPILSLRAHTLCRTFHCADRDRHHRHSFYFRPFPPSDDVGAICDIR